MKRLLNPHSSREEASGVTGPHAAQILLSVPSTVVPDERCFIFFFIDWKNHHATAPASFHWCFYQKQDWKSTGVTKTDQESGQAWSGFALPFNYGLVCDGVVLMSAGVLVFILKFLFCLVWKVKHYYTICGGQGWMDGWMEMFWKQRLWCVCVLTFIERWPDASMPVMVWLLFGGQLFRVDRLFLPIRIRIPSALFS